MPDVVRWGVLSTARIAQTDFLPALRHVRGVSLQAVASRDLAKARRLADEYGAPAAYGSYEELVADPAVDAVYNPLPNNLHHPWSIAAMRAGKHVLCEKPVAMNAQEAREMREAAQAAGVLMLEAFAYRFTPTMLRAIEIARSGVLGELRALHASFIFDMGQRAPDEFRLNPELGGGALYDVGCYCINALRMIAGREPRSVFARQVLSEPHGVDLLTSALLDMGDGLQATFHAGMNAPGATTLRAVGSRGRMEMPMGFAVGASPGSVVLTVDGDTQRFDLPGGHTLAPEVQDFTDGVRGVATPRYADDPLEANMRVIDACFASARSGRPQPVAG